MENIIQTFNDVETVLCNIMKDLGFSYNKIDLGDDDINFEVFIPTSGKFQKMPSIKTLMYIRKYTDSVYLVCGNIVKIDGEIDINSIYRKINDVNNLIDGGAFMVNDLTKQVVYNDSIYCGPNFTELNKEKIFILASSFMNNLFIFLDLMTKEK